MPRSRVAGGWKTRWRVARAWPAPTTQFVMIKIVWMLSWAESSMALVSEHIDTVAAAYPPNAYHQLRRRCRMAA